MKLANRFRVVVISLMLAGTILAQSGEKPWVPDKAWLMSARYNERPFDGYIRKKSTAISIGRAVMLEFYGDAFTKQIEPLNAKLLGDVWVVYSNHFEKLDGQPITGGPTTVEISRSTGTIINVRSER